MFKCFAQKGILLFLAVSILIMTCASCTFAENSALDALEAALALNNYPGHMKDMETKWYGENPFDDYLQIQKNPTTAADLPMGITKNASFISKNGITSFTVETLKNYGYRKDHSKALEKTDVELSQALEALFAADGTLDGLEAAKLAAANVEPRIKPALAEFLRATVLAYKLYRQLFINVTLETYQLFEDFIYSWPTWDDETVKQAYKISLETDENTRVLAGTLMIHATEELAHAVRKCGNLTKDGQGLNIQTPLGQIMFGTLGDDTYSSPQTLLLIDPAGNDTYEGKVASSISYWMPISVLIDIKGNDIYTATQQTGGTQGCGVLGCGVLFDIEGNDSYTACRASQAFAIHGTGVLYDGCGNDIYKSEISSQASAYYGYALLADVEGNDSYYAYGYSQAFAGNRAISFLADSSGNDNYIIEPYVQEGYESMKYDFGNASGNWSQGAGCGNRAISTDASGLAGGIAGLIDLEGNDKYFGGNWVQATGYWSGIGFLTDLGGNDDYSSVFYSQASVAHYGAGVLLDIGGDDLHTNTAGDNGYDAAGCYGQVWDRGVALFVDDGGNDGYSVNGRAFGCAWSEYDDKGEDKQDLTYAFFIDTEGDDNYSCSDDHAYGWGLGGYFFDLGGNDVYSSSLLNDTDRCLEVSTMFGVFFDKAKELNYKVPFWEGAKEIYFGK